jgi:hypothetical protein
MSGIRILALMLLAAGMLLHDHEAGAQARQPPPKWKDPAGPPVEMDAWLRRLVGRFRFEGVIHVLGTEDRSIKGVGDCVSIGAGPGVQCVLNVSWLDIYIVNFGGDNLDSPGGGVSTVPGAVSYLNPAMILFGLDPGKAAINHLLVDNKGLPEGGLGTNTGNRATFRTRCVNQPGVVGGCERILRIEAAADARILYIWIDVEMGPKGIDPPVSSIVLSLRRVAAG